MHSGVFVHPIRCQCVWCDYLFQEESQQVHAEPAAFTPGPSFICLFCPWKPKITPRPTKRTLRASQQSFGDSHELGSKSPKRDWSYWTPWYTTSHIARIQLLNFVKGEVASVVICKPSSSWHHNSSMEELLGDNGSQPRRIPKWVYARRIPKQFTNMWRLWPFSFVHWLDQSSWERQKQW